MEKDKAELNTLRDARLDQEEQERKAEAKRQQEKAKQKQEAERQRAARRQVREGAQAANSEPAPLLDANGFEFANDGAGNTVTDYEGPVKT